MIPFNNLSVLDQRRAAGVTLRNAVDPALGFLPQELRCHVYQNVPVLQRLQEREAERRHAQSNPLSFGAFQPRATLSSKQMIGPTADPSKPLADGSCPLLDKLPNEIRRMIFTQYLLPDKAVSIEPNRYRERERALQLEQTRAQAEIQRQRQVRQNAAQIPHQGTIGWNNSLLHGVYVQGQPQYLTTPVPNIFTIPPAPPLPSVLPPPPLINPHQTFAPHHGPAQPAGPNLTIAIPPPAGHNVPFIGGGQPTGNPLTGHVHGGNILQTTFHWPPVPTTLPFPQPPQNLLAPMNIPFRTVVGRTNSPTNRARQSVIPTASKGMDKYDATPEKLVTKLLTINSKLCHEISEIMYEEYTFEIHIHSNGVEFLHLDRIPTLETWGAEIANTMNAFKTRGNFCFQRMKHLELVFFGSDPADRLAGLNMRESVRKLIGFLRHEPKPVTTIKIRFEHDPFDKNKPAGLSNCFTDGIGNFWSTEAKTTGEGVSKKTTRDPRPSIIHNVFNVQLVCAPLKSLQRVSSFELKLPDDIKTDKDLVSYAAAMKSTIEAQDFHEDDYYYQNMLEEQLMDAKMDKELEIAGAGGCYRDCTRTADGSYILGSALRMHESEFTSEECAVIQSFGEEDWAEDMEEKFGIEAKELEPKLAASPMEKDHDHEV